MDPNSWNFIGFINNGDTRRLHPDFGGNSGSGYGIYGMPYAVVRNVTSSDLKSAQFRYSSESDGVDHTTNASFPFYPIPPEAITQPFRIDGDRNYLYELYNVFYNSSQGMCLTGSGAFFDMNTNNRRSDGWTSADAAGLAILPGLVRYDEVYAPTWRRSTMRSELPCAHQRLCLSGITARGCV